MKPLHGWRWRRRIRAIWTRVEQSRRARTIARGALYGLALMLRVTAIHQAAHSIVDERRVQARRRAAEAMARANGRRADELRKSYGEDAIDV